MSSGPHRWGLVTYSGILNMYSETTGEPGLHILTTGPHPLTSACVCVGGCALIHSDFLEIRTQECFRSLHQNPLAYPCGIVDGQLQRDGNSVYVHTFLCVIAGGLTFIKCPGMESLITPLLLLL